MKIRSTLFYPVILILTSATLNAQQNVGIGTTIPSEKLHVAGNVKADTIKPNAVKLIPNAGTGKILTSDAAGNASWQKISAMGSTGFGPWASDCATIATISGYQPVTDSTGVAGDRFGNTVAISGNFAIIGAPYDDVGANVDQGSVSFYQFNGTNWIFLQKITDATGAANDYFGFSVSISGNYAVVGDQNDDVGANADQGSASFYEFKNGSWQFAQKISDASGAADDNFGNWVSVSGNVAVIGAIFDDIGVNNNQGSASIYQYTAGNWVFVQQITDPAGAANDLFGRCVSISGNYIIVGALGHDVGANINQGSANVYQYNGSSWVFMQQLLDATGAANDAFGVSVSVSGNFAVVGAQNDDVVANTDQGSVIFFQYNGSSWVLMQKTTDPAGATNDNFGNHVFISGNYCIVGASGDDINSNFNQGSASIYMRVGLAWQRLQYLTDPAGSSGDTFGVYTAIDGSTQYFLVGAMSYASSSGKALFGKIN